MTRPVASAVSRIIGRIEARLGVRLLEQAAFRRKRSLLQIPCGRVLDGE
jgi:hypothetical protein